MIVTLLLALLAPALAAGKCKFPFRYGGKKYDECTMADHDQPWCKKKGGGWMNCEPQAEPAPPGGGWGEESGEAGWVADTNHFRALHGAGPVVWDSDLAAKAQKWAEHIHNQGGLVHSDSYGTWPPSGENLAFGYGSSCNAGKDFGGPKLYSGPYDQHCVVASWYGEYYLWRGSGDWQAVDGLGHFTALAWKGVDTIGCASSGKYYVCEYGSKDCKGHGQYGGQSCWATSPPHLPNFNKGSCSNARCVESFFDAGVAVAVPEVWRSAGASQMAALSAVGMLVAGSLLVALRLRAPAPSVGGDGDEGSPMTLQQDCDEGSNALISE